MKKSFGYSKFSFRYYIILLFAISYSASSSANIQCTSFLDEEYIVYEHLNQDTYAKTEIFHRNNDIGPQQYGSLTVEKWYELTFEFNELDVKNFTPTSVVGLTKEGRLYHIVKLEGRTLARLLSGTHSFKTFQVSNKGRIMAWKVNGKSYFYSSELWNTSPINVLKKRWLKLWGLTSVGAAVTSNALMGQMPFPVEFFGFVFNFPLIELMYSGAAGLSSGLAILSSYEQLNTYPNGFVAVGYNTEKDFWIFDDKLKTGSSGNLTDFDPPELMDLKPQLSPELSEPIRD